MVIAPEDYALLNRHAAAFALIFNEDFKKLRGVIDTPNKIYCAYSASELLGFKDYVLAVYFKIDPRYLRNKLIDVKIDLEVYTGVLLRMASVRDLWECVMNENFEIDA